MASTETSVRPESSSSATLSPIGRNERFDEWSTARVVAASRHLLNQHAAAGSRAFVQGARIGGVIALAHVLTHFDGRDRVERLIGQRPVVLDADLDPIVEAPLAARHIDVGLLLSREGEAHDLSAVVHRGMQTQRAPTTSDIE
jgi:hypothetical protein